MDLLSAIILGIIQGLTEYLPVSSSGHLELGKIMMGIESVDPNSPYGITFNVFLHLATVFSTWIIFRKEINQLLSGLFQFKLNEEFYFSLKILISMVPAAVIGLLFEEHIDHFFSGSSFMIGCMLILTGILLFFANKATQTDQSINFKSAFWVGIAQAIALAPGISRSGATISTCVLLKVDKEKAAQFSFIMVMPLIIAKVLKDLMEGKFIMDTAVLLPMGAGFIAAFLVGLLACNMMLSIVKNGKLIYFSVYCFIVGLSAICYELI